jgi:hypothetical protein
MAALRGLCISPEFRAVVVREGILDPLVLMSRSEDVMVSPIVMSAALYIFFLTFMAVA